MSKREREREREREGGKGRGNPGLSVLVVRVVERGGAGRNARPDRERREREERRGEKRREEKRRVWRDARFDDIYGSSIARQQGIPMRGSQETKRYDL